MFKKAILTTSVFTALVSLGWIFNLIYPSFDQMEEYRHLKKAGKVMASTTPQESTRQYRNGVRKDLWLAQPDQSRLHDRIESANSILTLIPCDDKLDIVENLKQLKCWMQDKLYNQNGLPMQQMRFFVADEGLYQYSTQKFTAKSVALSVFRLPGTQLLTQIDPSKAFLQGIAQDVSFSIAEKNPQFQAQHFKANLIAQEE